MYDLLVPLLSNTRHVVTFDFLGWGKSQSPVGQKYPVSVQVDDIFAVMSSLKLDTVDIVVHDLSGHPGIDWALANPNNVAKLVVREKFVPFFAHDGAYMRAFDKPVQIIFGENDPSLNPGVAADFQKIFKNSKLTLIKDAGHYVQLDKPEIVADLIR